MFQTKGINSEEEFNKVIKIFEETIVTLHGEEDNTEWDMDAIYTPIFACLWNKPSNIGQKCKIDCKNNLVAIVYWQDDKEILESIYRLEDLVKIN